MEFHFVYFAKTKAMKAAAKSEKMPKLFHRAVLASHFRSILKSRPSIGSAKVMAMKAAAKSEKKTKLFHRVSLGVSLWSF